MTDGLEWNVKVTTKEIPHIIDKFQKTFESYWNNAEFELYDESQVERLEKSLTNNGLGKATLEIVNFFDLKPYHYQSEILEKLKDFMIRSYFIGKTLHADLPVNIKEYKSHDFNMKRNVRAGSDLKYETKEGQQKLIKFVSKQKGTSKTITVEVK